jgi:hypothetical protein
MRGGCGLWGVRSGCKINLLKNHENNNFMATLGDINCTRNKAVRDKNTLAAIPLLNEVARGRIAGRATPSMG